MIGTTDRLPPKTRHALRDAGIIVLDLYLEDLGRLAQGEPLAETSIADALPRKYLSRYDLPFAKDFVICVSTVAWKLHSPDSQELACVAEELALSAIIQQAGVNLELQGLEADLYDVYEEAFQDTDFEFLFDPQFDGIDRSEMADYMRMANLRFDDWFKPVANVPYVHQFVAAAPARPHTRRT